MGWYNQANNSYVITDRYVVVFFQSIAKDFIILLDMSVCYTIFIYYRTVYQFLWAELVLIVFFNFLGVH